MKNLRMGAPMIYSGRTIIPIESARVEQRLTASRFWAFALKEPWAIVEVVGQDARAISVSGDTVEIGQLCSDVPGLTQLLNNLRR
jgi:hypothetical protein